MFWVPRLRRMKTTVNAKVIHNGAQRQGGTKLNVLLNYIKKNLII